jgi:DNA-binding transcriptional ArsR family regulator
LTISDLAEILRVVLVERDADELLRAFAHPARREIVRRCWAAPVSAGELSDALGLAPASTSEHLKVLRKTGLVVLTKDGTYRRYRTDPARLAAVVEWLAAFPNHAPPSR